jgi:hypothetical protein
VPPRRASADEYIELRKYADEIPVGTTETKRVCPFCRGGTHGDRGFSVTRSDEATVKYKCHRATCGRAGVIAAWGHRLAPKDSGDTPLPIRKFTPRLYLGNTGELGGRWVSSLSHRFGLSKEELDKEGWSEDIETGRLIVPVCSPLGVRRGFESRRAPWQDAGGSKTLHYRDRDEVWMGWTRNVKSGPIVLVEDLISALKVGRQFQTCSLMGTYLGEDHVEEILEVGGNVIIALDKDATDKAYGYVREWNLLIPNFRHVRLSKDLKYSTDEEILSILS